MESYGNDRKRFARVLDTIAMVAADASFGERPAVARALYAVLLADTLDLTPAHASEKACEAAWNEPERELSRNTSRLVDEAERAMMAALNGEGDGGRFYVDRHVSDEVKGQVHELVNSGHKIAAIKILREETGLGLRECKELAETFVDRIPERPMEFNSRFASLVDIGSSGDELENEPPF